MATRDLKKNQNTQRNILNAQTRQTRNIIKKEYSDALNKVRIELSKLYEKYSINGILSYAEMSKFNRLQKLEKEMVNILNTTYANTKKYVVKMSSLQLEQAFYRYSWTIDQNLGVELNWGLINTKAVDQTLSNPLFLNAIRDLPVNGKQYLKRAITQGLIQGSSIKNMVRSVNGALGRSFKELERIVRTESHRVIEAGIQEQFLKGRRLGVDLRKQLIATLDDRTRPQSAQMDGQVSNEDGLFTYPNGVKGIPGNTGVPEYDINDRERSIEIINGIGPGIRRTREDGIIPFKTYKQWASEKGIKKNRYGQKLF